MKNQFLQILILIIVVTTFNYGQSNSLKNITPLYSTRSEVEKTLGKAKDSFSISYSKYETPEAQIEIEYASKQCDQGWDVPKDTVLGIFVYSRKDAGKSFDELKLDKSKFSSSIDDALYGTWTNADEGVSYHFGNVSMQFISTHFIPKKSDNHLRCNGFPPYSADQYHFTMERYLFYNSDLTKADGLMMTLAQSDGFIMNVLNNADYKGYVLIYFDSKLPFKEYRNRVEKLKNHIYRKRRAPRTLVTVIEGGMKENSEIEYYILPKDWKAPAPNPTLASPQFMRNSRK